jgi:hypothetical protein
MAFHSIAAMPFWLLVRLNALGTRATRRTLSPVPDSGTAVASPGSYDAALLDALAEVIGEGLKPLTVR